LHGYKTGLRKITAILNRDLALGSPIRSGLGVRVRNLFNRLAAEELSG